VALIEKQPVNALAQPAFDGREIALTQASQAMLEDLGAWNELPAEEVHRLGEARVLNGDAPGGLPLRAMHAGRDRLATLVSNHRLRAALFRVATATKGIELFDDDQVIEMAPPGNLVALKLGKAGWISSRLLVAADSRLSDMRRRLGIAAEMRQLGQSMLTVRVEHDIPHEQRATEWFGHRCTIAALPLAPGLSSLIITMSEGDLARLMQLPEQEFSRQAERLSEGRFGALRIASSRHVYPLLMTYAQRFACVRGALVGDAAVGMHPVTAHGFNFGLRSQKTLTEEILIAAASGLDIGSASPLRKYERRHQQATRPLYLATNALVRLYTDESFPGRQARRALLYLAGRLPLMPQAVSAVLMSS
jgi:ubiquinone biosynthesis UbiH/UbiF/VisC/COQ6 family hydroxylase